MNRIHSFPITPLWFILKICAISLKPAVAVPTWLKQCGERDINLKNKFNGYKEYISSLLISFLIALLISIAVFTAIYLCGEKIINEYVSSDSYIYNTQAAYITDFQKYVSDNKVSSNDFKSIDTWIQREKPEFFLISIDNETHYVSTDIFWLYNDRFWGFLRHKNSVET